MWLENHISAYQRGKKTQHPPIMKGFPSRDSSTILSARCSFDIFISSGVPLRIERDTFGSSLQDVQVVTGCCEGASSNDSFVILLQGFFWAQSKHEGRSHTHWLAKLFMCKFVCTSCPWCVYLTIYNIIYKELAPLHPSRPVFFDRQTSIFS